MRESIRRSFLDRGFRLSITLKGLHALVETMGGITLLAINPQTLNRFVLTVLHQELSEDPRDFIATHLLHTSQSFSAGGTHFAAWYLLSHGVVKLILVVELFMNKLWAYPLMIMTLAAFVCYQVYRFARTGSLIMILLTLFDLAVILLTWLEYRKQRSCRYAELPRT